MADAAGAGTVGQTSGPVVGSSVAGGPVNSASLPVRDLQLKSYGLPGCYEHQALLPEPEAESE